MDGNAVKESVYGGLIGGIVFLFIQMLFPLLLGQSGWQFPKMAGAILLGKNSATPFGEFDVTVLLSGLLIHFILSAFYGLILGFFVNNLSRAGATISGVLFGIVLYLINFYLFTELFPWFSDIRSWIAVLSHATFGGVVGFAFKELQIKYGHCVNCY